MHPLIGDDIESELSYAYLHAVASKIGAASKVGNRHEDNNGVDASITAWGLFLNGGYIQEVDLKIQLKATIGVPVDKGNHLSYFLSGLKRYNDLRSDAVAVHRILIIMFLPADANHWLTINENELVLKKCAYWVSLRGAAASANGTGETVYIPKTQIFNPENLMEICARLSRKESTKLSITMSFNFQNIAPTDLRDLAKSLGWQQFQQAVADNLYVLNNPLLPKRQLVFLLNSDAPDYGDSVELVLNKIAEIQNKTLGSVISELTELKDDTLRFRVVDARNEDSYIPLSYAVSAINGAKEMFLSAACSVLKPQSFHPRLSRTEAQELVEKSRFRHTETGSFVLKVSTPVNAMELQGNIFPEENFPFVRQTTLTINQGLAKLVTAIEADTLTQLVDEIKQDPKTEISSNLCKAVTNFQEEHNDFDLYIDFTWAGSLPVPANILTRKIIKIQKDYFSRIDDVRRELRDTAQEKKKQEDVFMASVERLEGELGNDGKRSGEVIFNLYQSQSEEIIRARTILNAEQYSNADKAHMTADAYIKLKGKLHSGNQPRNFTEISQFDLIMP